MSIFIVKKNKKTVFIGSYAEEYKTRSWNSLNTMEHTLMARILGKSIGTDKKSQKKKSGVPGRKKEKKKKESFVGSAEGILFRENVQNKAIDKVFFT